MPRLDAGLFIGTYIGYWLGRFGDAVAIGVIASFLTSNITIGFVLGVLFNMPLVFLVAVADACGSMGQQSALVLKQWSISQRLADFSHGVLTLSGLAYFAIIIVVMLYVSMALDRPPALVCRKTPLDAGVPFRCAIARVGGDRLEHCRRLPTT